MITYKPIDNLVSYNTYRPSLLEESQFLFWEELHEYIKECDYPIVVNSIFKYIDECIETKSNYGGGGFKYMFWFESEHDKDTFKTYFMNLCLKYKFTLQHWMFEIDHRDYLDKPIYVDDTFVETVESKTHREIQLNNFNKYVQSLREDFKQNSCIIQKNML